MGNNKIQCDECLKKFRARNVILFRGKYICTNCKMKRKTTSMGLKFPQMISLQGALDKVYSVKLKFRGDGKWVYCDCAFPKILAGKKFKIKLIDESSEKNRNGK